MPATAHNRGVPIIARDRLRRLVDLLLESLDEPEAQPLAQRAFLSRFHLDRLLATGLREPPATLRRRLLLERAGWQLRRGISVTDAGLQAGYSATESFIRAFRRVHGVAPGRFAGGDGDFRVAAPNGIHFHPPAGLILPATGGDPLMSLTQRLLEHDRWMTDELIEHAGRLPEPDLDREVRPGHEVLHFDGKETTVREMLEKLVFTKEVWSAAIRGRSMPEERDRSLAGLKRRHGTAGTEFVELARETETKRAWDSVFVDALCEPPESFTFGSVFAHVITHSAYRRRILLDTLKELGLKDLPNGDPIQWEQDRLS